MLMKTNVELTEENLNRDENGKFIKTEDYNCDRCDKRKNDKWKYSMSC